jgi:hypothetical protein
LLSSYIRRNPAEREDAIQRFESFVGWAKSVRSLARIASNDDMLFAIAQHYGLPTTLVDFSTEPKVAAFFATHKAPPPPGHEDVSCIICLDPDELRAMCSSLRVTRPQLVEPRAVVLDVPDLLRLQAQRGVFLEYPYDESFERVAFGFDRIVFPTERNPARLTRMIPVEDIYPTQKSDLEVLLDQFFMLEQMAEGTAALRRIAKAGTISIHTQAAPPDGIEAECFGNGGLPAHTSWDERHLAKWLHPPNETWTPISSAARLRVQYPKAGKSSTKVQALTQQITQLLLENPASLAGPLKWELVDASADSRRVTRAMELVWDGLRQWPYPLAEVAESLAAVVEFGLRVSEAPDACNNPALAEKLVEEVFGEVMEVEIAIEDGSYTRGYASYQLLRSAVRHDFHSFLNAKWRPQITDIRSILQVASNPSHVFVFDQLASVFCTQIIPTQVVLRDEGSGRARLYNLARATRVGLP